MSGAVGNNVVWLFGYGSLIYKTGFSYIERRPASIRHWVRRLWQGSHDHRGTSESPGRVATLIEERDAVCQGVAYRISSRVLELLDIREKNGYRQLETKLWFGDGTTTSGLVYIARQDNAAFLGPAPEKEIARQVSKSTGSSGHNAEYVTRLAAALRAMSVHDAHVFAVEQYLFELESGPART